MSEKSHQMGLFENQTEYSLDEPVECLGLVFANDADRRAYFTELLRERLKDPEFRKIEGFPIGEDEDILALSDPPYYTACPNPWIADFVAEWEAQKPPKPAGYQYHREPFAADVSEGKNDPIYNAHSYHTKVPHKAIMRYILHYTEPGDIVFDGFCGTGMTGVAAQMCGDQKEVESLGYRVEADGAILQQEPDETGRVEWRPFSKLGARRVILNDLSPAATFIAQHYVSPLNASEFEREVRWMLRRVKDKCGWMYQTLHSDKKTECDLNYAIWSDVFVCPECAAELVFWEVAVDQDNGLVRSEFNCPNCNIVLTKRALNRAYVTSSDPALGTPVTQAKQVPVLYNYMYARRAYKKTLDDWDRAQLERIDSYDANDWFPAVRMPEGDESRRNDEAGITHTHHFYSKRNRVILAVLLAECSSSFSKWLVTGIMQRASRQHQIAISRIGGPKAGEGGATAGHRRGTLYIPSNQVEFNPYSLISERLGMVLKTANRPWSANGNVALETASATQTRIHSNGVDYIFTDPPFGGNIMYSELNFIWESTLKVKTNPEQEAVTNRTRRKALLDYQHLMFRCFAEYFRVLRPGRWMTVEFHNSKNSVWSSIQEALQKAGFVVADVRVLDKKIETHTQRTAGGSVNKDLAITAYKPNNGLEERFKLSAGTEAGAWDFVRSHLKQLPVFVSKDGRAEAIAERQNYLLYDRMVAFHVQRGVTVPLSAAEFYKGLSQRFAERDGMYFLPEQAVEFDRKRLSAKEVVQLEIFVANEDSAIQWIRQQLTARPQTFQDLQPRFMQETKGGWQKYEMLLELRELLEQNFLHYDGKGEVPSQIHSYLSTNYKDMRNLVRDDPVLKSMAKDRWYVPDPNKAADLDKLRERGLLREFQTYHESKQRRLKVFRLEAVRAGFKRAWQESDYATIIAVARKIPDDVLHEDPKLLMWYDQALTRTGQME